MYTNTYMYNLQGMLFINTSIYIYTYTHITYIHTYHLYTYISYTYTHITYIYTYHLYTYIPYTYTHHNSIHIRLHTYQKIQRLKTQKRDSKQDMGWLWLVGSIK